jgi:hypothetical protein
MPPAVAHTASMLWDVLVVRQQEEDLGFHPGGGRRRRFLPVGDGRELGCLFTPVCVPLHLGP